MCGRFTLRTPLPVLIKHFQLGLAAQRQLPLLEPRYNIAPTQDILAIRKDAATSERTADLLRWGLVPSCAKELQSGAPLINARAETIAEMPAFRSALRKRRCLIPTDGFFEWRQFSAGSRNKKQPYLIHRRDDEPFAFAGIWEVWTAKAAPTPHRASDEPSLTVESCTIVTTTANHTLTSLHDPMPDIVSPTDYERWLDPAIQDPAEVGDLLVPYADKDLVAEPVSTHVNSVANDDPQCVAVQRSLFD